MKNNKMKSILFIALLVSGISLVAGDSDDITFALSRYGINFVAACEAWAGEVPDDYAARMEVQSAHNGVRVDEGKKELVRRVRFLLEAGVSPKDTAQSVYGTHLLKDIPSMVEEAAAADGGHEDDGLGLSGVLSGLVSSVMAWNK